MRKLSSILSGIACILLAASCAQDLEGTLYRPNSDDGKEIHFSVSSMSKSFPEDDKSGILEISIVRPGTKGSHTIGLSQMGSYTDIFSFPETATIEDGEYSTIIPVLVDLSKCQKGLDYATSLYIIARDQATGDYGAQNAQYSDAMDIKVSIDLTWEPLMILNEATGETIQQTASYDYSLYWHGRSTGMPVEKAVCEQTIYRVNGWGTNDLPFMWIVNEDGSCVVPKQNTGTFNTTYNQYIFVSDFPNDIYLSSPATYSAHPCTFDGDRTFSFSLIYYREGSTGNFGNGVETLTFDSLIPTSPSVSISYNGIDSTATGFTGARIAFKPTESAKSYLIAICPSELDSAQVAAVADSLAVSGKMESGIVTATLYSSDEQSWKVQDGPNTAVAVAFDEEGQRGETTSLVFTFDPEGKYAVKVRSLAFLCDETNTDYDPTTSLYYNLKTQNLAAGWRVCTTLSAWKSQMKTQTPEEYLKSKSSNRMDASYIKAANSTSGRSGWYSTLKAGTEYIMAFYLENEFGEGFFISDTASTKSLTTSAITDEFRQDVTMDDFLGSYLMTADVGRGKTTDEYTMRVDINRMDDNRVVITGLGSPIQGFSPMVTGFYDSERHCIIVNTQNVGTFEGDYIHFCMYYGKDYSSGSTYSYAGALMLGWVDDQLTWVSSPDFTTTYYGYTFGKFTSEYASSTTSLKSVINSMFFSSLRMTPLKNATD